MLLGRLAVCLLGVELCCAHSVSHLIAKLERVPQVSATFPASQATPQATPLVPLQEDLAVDMLKFDAGDVMNALGGIRNRVEDKAYLVRAHLSNTKDTVVDMVMPATGPPTEAPVQEATRYDPYDYTAVKYYRGSPDDTRMRKRLMGADASPRHRNYSQVMLG
jgi:hypothetical protein